MGTIPSYPEASTPLGDTDTFYLEQGLGSDRGKRATVQMLKDVIARPFAKLSLANSTLKNYLAISDSLPVSAHLSATDPSYMLVDPLPLGKGWTVRVHLSLIAETRYGGGGTFDNAQIHIPIGNSGWESGTAPDWGDDFIAAMVAGIPTFANATVRTILGSPTLVRPGSVGMDSGSDPTWYISTPESWGEVLSDFRAPIDIEATIYAL